MIRIGPNDFQTAFGAVSEMAEREPLIITKQGRDHLVVMSAEEYQRLSSRDGNARHAGGMRGEFAVAGTDPAGEPQIAH